MVRFQARNLTILRLFPRVLKFLNLLCHREAFWLKAAEAPNEEVDAVLKDPPRLRLVSTLLRQARKLRVIVET